MYKKVVLPKYEAYEKFIAESSLNFPNVDFKLQALLPFNEKYLSYY